MSDIHPRTFDLEFTVRAGAINWSVRVRIRIR